MVPLAGVLFGDGDEQFDGVMVAGEFGEDEGLVHVELVAGGGGDGEIRGADGEGPFDRGGFGAGGFGDAGGG